MVEDERERRGGRYRRKGLGGWVEGKKRRGMEEREERWRKTKSRKGEKEAKRRWRKSRMEERREEDRKWTRGREQRRIRGR